ncbi:MAG: 50S ribosomal protein L11 methyltransferase [Syntrophobacteria bacterium]
MFLFYRINGTLAVGGPWWRFLVSRAPAGILLQTSRTFPPAHPTTKMCLRLMLRDLRERHRRSLVDVGCGSGILALAGLRLGIERATALDLCPRAVSRTRANAELNRLGRGLLLVRGSTEALAARFDLVLANLPMPLLTDKLSELVRLADCRASLILSGFQDVEKPLVMETMSQQGLMGTCWLSEDLSFYAVPPSGSFTWMAVLACRRCKREE